MEFEDALEEELPDLFPEERGALFFFFPADFEELPFFEEPVFFDVLFFLELVFFSAIVLFLFSGIPQKIIVKIMVSTPRTQQ